MRAGLQISGRAGLGGRLRRARRGASLTGYALVVGLIAVVAIAATTRVGEEVTELFGLVGEDLDSVADGAGPGGSGSGETPNQPPAAPTLSNSQIQENSGAAATVGTLSASDPDAGQSVSFSLGTNGGDEAIFQIVGGNELQATQDFDFEAPSDTGGTAGDNVYVVEVIATDDGSPAESSMALLEVTVTDDTCAGGNVIGCEASDGAFFVGNVGGNDIFIAPTDETDAPDMPNSTNDGGTFFAWNNGQHLETPADSPTDGLANTQALVNPSTGDDPDTPANCDLSQNNPTDPGCEDDDDGPHPAANVCATKSLGSADWYLPGRDELQAVWDNLVGANCDPNSCGDGDGTITQSEADAIPELAKFSFDFEGQVNSGAYWSSSENEANLSTTHAWLVGFNDGIARANGSKSGGVPVRCVRR